MSPQDTVGRAVVPRARQSQQVFALFALEVGVYLGLGAAQSHAPPLLYKFVSTYR